MITRAPESSLGNSLNPPDTRFGRLPMERVLRNSLENTASSYYIEYSSARDGWLLVLCFKVFDIKSTLQC